MAPQNANRTLLLLLSVAVIGDGKTMPTSLGGGQQSLLHPSASSVEVGALQMPSTSQAPSTSQSPVLSKRRTGRQALEGALHLFDGDTSAIGASPGAGHLQGLKPRSSSSFKVHWLLFYAFAFYICARHVVDKFAAKMARIFGIGRAGLPQDTVTLALQLQNVKCRELKRDRTAYNAFLKAVGALVQEETSIPQESIDIQVSRGGGPKESTMVKVSISTAPGLGEEVQASLSVGDCLCEGLISAVRQGESLENVDKLLVGEVVCKVVEGPELLPAAVSTASGDDPELLKEAFGCRPSGEDRSSWAL